MNPLPLRELFEELGYCAQCEDYSEVAAYLKMLLLRIEPDQKKCVPCSGYDKKIVETFWRRLLNISPFQKNVFAQSVPLYGMILGASADLDYSKLRTAAGCYCQAMSLLCRDLAEEASASSESLTVRHLRVYAGGLK